MVTIEKGPNKIKIEKGELISFVNEGHEIIHQKGSPGWRNSDTEMFPIIGPTAKADYKVVTPKGNAVQDQHGLLRELTYILVSNTNTEVVYQKKYEANSKVNNSKYPEKSTQKELYWPYNFTFTKRFTLDNEGLSIVFTIDAEKEMPFMLGYHPAFKIYTESPIIATQSQQISLKEVLEVGDGALEIANSEEIILKDKKNVVINTKGFRHFMLWTTVTNMVCIEPISFYGSKIKQTDLHSGFSKVGDNNVYEVRISVN